jgi:ADP-ribose pyrophosphatase YjhB (NUDIX family)
MVGMEDTELPERQAGRVIAIDPAGRILLFRYEDPPPKGAHWATPGGGLEPGEDFYAAACRELAEETGWADVPVAPGEVHREQNMQWSRTRGRQVRNEDRFFVGRVAVERRPLAEVAAMHASDRILETRWWTLAELDATDQSIYPRGLAALIRRLTMRAS